VIGVIVRLQAMTLRGRVVRSLRLLRQPKYLIGSLAAAAWMLLWVGPPMMRSGVAFQTAVQRRYYASRVAGMSASPPAEISRSRSN